MPLTDVEVLDAEGSEPLDGSPVSEILKKDAKVGVTETDGKIVAIVPAEMKLLKKPSPEPKPPAEPKPLQKGKNK